MVKRMLFVFMLAGVVMAAEKEKPAESTGPVASKVFILKHARPDQFYGYLSRFGVQVLALPGTQAMAVSGPPAVVQAIEEYLKLIDVPRAAIRNVQLIGYLLMATHKPPQQPDVPQVLEPVVKQLKSLFAYQGFSLIQTVAIRGREGEAGSAHGALGWPAEGSGSGGAFAFEFRRLSITPDIKGALIRTEGLNFTANVPGPGGSQAVQIRTDVDIREGQKVVIGKANTDAAGSALVLVLTAEVME